MASVYVDPTAPAGGDGSLSKPLNSWKHVTWQPGTAYLQKAGTAYNGSFEVTGDGTEASPIIMGSYGDGAAPVINGSVVFTGAQHITMMDFTVQKSNLAGIGITGGSHHITVNENVITKNAVGVWFSQTAGQANVIADNVISENAQNGVAFDRVTSGAGAENRVEGNQIHFNGGYGIDVFANHVVVEDNTVFLNGGRIPGTSGIHVYATSFAEGLGRHNVIRGNVAYGNLDAGGNDGIGILVDHYTSNNLVENNLAFSNDGVGIAIYASSNNVVKSNTMFGNMVDRSKTHGLHSEFAINTNAALGKGLASGNFVENNVALSYDQDVFAIYVDPESATNATVSDANTWQNNAGGKVYLWGSSSGTSESQWNALPRVGSDSFTGVPLASQPVGDLEIAFQSGFGLPFDGRVAAIRGWDNEAGLIGDYLM